MMIFCYTLTLTFVGLFLVLIESVVEILSTIVSEAEKRGKKQVLEFFIAFVSFSIIILGILRVLFF